MTLKFTENANQVISAAVISAGELRHAYVGTEHILLGITMVPDCTAARFLRAAGITGDSVKKQIVALAGTGSRSGSGGEDMTPKCRKILMKAGRLARDSGDDAIGTEHILHALLSEECVALRIVEMEGVAPGDICDMLNGIYPCGLAADKAVPLPSKRRETPTIDENARDLTEAARRGEIPVMTGREREEERVIRILLRKTKNNPCLIGGAGVGKTAVAESLARRIADGRVPPELEGSRIMALEMSSVVAGTKYRGEFEEKLRKIIAEARSDPSVILFVDEIHTVVGAGSAEGSVDAANILKPPLARGEIRLIGATTAAEYKRAIEKDSALERRFQPVSVCEPDDAQCVKMLLAVKGSFEKHHRLKISDEAVREAVRVSSKYIHDRFLPDKAIDLLDEAAAAKRTSARGTAVSAADIDALAEETTGIPLRTLTRSDAEELRLLEEKLSAAVIGQEGAVAAVCAAVRRAKAVRHDRDRPLCSLLLAGSGGVGKTLCCKTLADCVFGGSGRLFKLDMSEFSEPHSISRLIGSPPGYVGSCDGGILTERVRRQPFSLIFFDGVERAHPDIISLIYDILENGTLADASGLEVSFRSAFVVISTSAAFASRTAGFGADGGQNPEKLPSGIAERVDETIFFSPLSPSALAEIAIKEAREFAERQKTLVLDKSYEEHIRTVASLPGASARTLCAAVRRDCGNAAAEAVLSGAQSVTLCFGSDGVEYLPTTAGSPRADGSMVVHGA